MFYKYIEEILKRHHTRANSTSQVRKTLFGIEIPRLVAEKHTVVVNERTAQICGKARFGFRFPPAMRHTHRSRFLTWVEVRHKLNRPMPGGNARPCAFHHIANYGVVGMYEKPRLRLALAQETDLMEVRVVVGRLTRTSEDLKRHVVVAKRSVGSS